MQRIRELREERGLTQVRLAVDADMNPATLNRIEQGKANPNLKTLERLANTLGVEVVDLFPKPQAPQPSLEDAAQSEAFQEALAVLYRGLARHGQRILQQAHEHGSPAVFSGETAEFHKQGQALLKMKATLKIPPSMFGHDSDELAEAEDEYAEVAGRIGRLLEQVVDAPEKAEESQRLADARKSKVKKDPEIEESRADAS